LKLTELFDQKDNAKSLWQGMYKIPWDEPEFSKRMLEEHLSQEHDLASRRTAMIDKHVNWIHTIILNKKPSKILDLCCGPGFYTSRLSEIGHSCRGIDFSPASIEYAREHMNNDNRVEYIHEDIISADYGSNYDLILLIYGEFNVFPKNDALKFLQKAYNALKQGGQILIEAHTFDVIKNLGQSGNSWTKEKSGLFSDKPHLLLVQNRWHDDEKAAQSTYIIIDVETASADLYRNTIQAYTNDEYKTLFEKAGFRRIECIPAWGKASFDDEDTHLLLRAHK
jgi:SAM-dependent methyltransferase